MYTRASNGLIGERAATAGGRVESGILTTISISSPYDRLSSSGLFMGVMLYVVCVDVYGYDCRCQFQTDVRVRLEGGKKRYRTGIIL